MFFNFLFSDSAVNAELTIILLMVINKTNLGDDESMEFFY